MKHNFPQVDLPVEMLAWRDVTEDILNLYRQSCRLKACIFALCTEGTITASINLMEHEIKKNDLIILMPGTILQLNEQVEKVRLCFVGFSSHCVNGINLLQATMGSFSKIWDNPIVNVSDLIASYFVDYFALQSPILPPPVPQWHKVCSTAFCLELMPFMPIVRKAFLPKAAKRKSAKNSYNWLLKII